MQRTNITAGQIRELCDLDRSKKGIGNEVQNLIGQLTKRAGLGNIDERLAHAISVWHPRYSLLLGYKNFWEFLEDVPMMPSDRKGYSQCLLVPELSFETLCAIGQVKANLPSQNFHDYKLDDAKPHWIFCQHKNGLSETVASLRDTLSGEVHGLNMREGISLLLQQRSMSIPRPYMCLGHTTYESEDGEPYVACLQLTESGVELRWHPESLVHNRNGGMAVRLHK